MPPNTSRGGVAAAAAAAGAAALGVAVGWGFTVDDAWITARVAYQLAHGVGYRFNPGGAPVDAVTPLGWVFALVPFAGSSVVGALQAARVLGALTWIAAAAHLGYRLHGAGKGLGLAGLLLAAPSLGAWASAGMETGFVLALCTCALGESVPAMLCAGLAAALRPELVPFCFTLSLRALATPAKPVVRKVLPAALVLGFAVAVAVTRDRAFGHALPLATFAKPSDLGHGLRYGLGVLLFLGPTWLWLGNGWKGLGREELVVAAAVVVHLLAVIAAGGDWMPLWRLAVPTFPAALWVAASLRSRQRPVTNALGWVASVGVVSLVGYQVGLPARHVMRARLDLAARVRPLLIDAKQVVALDVGWLGAAYPGPIIDLAGVTDPRVARLAGGHTTKNIRNSWFEERHPDALLLLTAPNQAVHADWRSVEFARTIENRIKRMPYWQACRLRAAVNLQYTTQRYFIVRC